MDSVIHLWNNPGLVGVERHCESNDSRVRTQQMSPAKARTRSPVREIFSPAEPFNNFLLGTSTEVTIFEIETELSLKNVSYEHLIHGTFAITFSTDTVFKGNMKKLS